MRISTNTIYQSGISKISNLQSEQFKLMQQISTGQRIASPSDDPVASARALEVSHAKSINSKFADTRQTAQLKLNTLESNLTSVTNMMISVKSAMVSAGNPTYSDLERGFIASELKTTLDGLIGLANTRDAAGNYLYAGFETDTAPFVANASGASYVGDSNKQMLQVDSQRQMAVNATGDEVFQAGGNDIFATLQNLVTLLNTPLTPANQAAFTAGVATGLTSIQQGLDNVLTVRASIGSRLNEIDQLDVSGDDLELQYSKSLSEIQDLDYAAALSDLSKNQTIMEAAQKSFVATTSLSLFNFI
ncbi:flagellar hook-associated protein FlgL [Methylotenera mobilis]|jgi:flagellar hook-associated protein 3 FlgL|uniref:Flagellar hook-associated protein 3 n=1 Tax=Methylotenera mobilis TaxID=359408 RepID=A0A351RAG4_9PROT|nr:flagellar hook-associated protein FlgL [Methylotenera mobilis]PPD48079.1 MAG: flagellar hook-associated protein 3 [Methylotenera sp.]HBA09035.1 flagellar hook-associated protein 3 [Methylotenera mobilis]